MANTEHFPVQHRDRQCKLLDFSFVPNGSSDPDPTLFRGSGVKAITHVSDGKWTVELDDVYPHQLRPPVYSIKRGTPATAAIDFHTTADTIDSDGKFSFVYREDHVAADIAANTNSRIGISLALLNLTPGG